MDLKTLRSSRTTDFSKISSEFEKAANGSKNFTDNRFWKPERDKAGNATATIRFLARTEGDELPWVKVWNHAFKHTNDRWYIDNCSSTISQPCPVCELNGVLWQASTDDKGPERTQARNQKRKLNYISNILVINDPKHPENNGQVFLFKYGKKIFDKLMDKARPTFEDEQPVNVFDYWEGANFKLRMKMVDKFPNYDSSEFESVTAVASTDEEILVIANNQYKLSEFVAVDQFKSYDDQKKRLGFVLATGISATAATTDLAPNTTHTLDESGAISNIDEESDESVMEYFQRFADE